VGAGVLIIALQVAAAVILSFAEEENRVGYSFAVIAAALVGKAFRLR
jgi:hypothetical protein